MMYIYIYIFIYTMGLSLRMGITVGIRKLRDKRQWMTMERSCGNGSTKRSL